MARLKDLIVSHIDSVPVSSKKGVFTIGEYGTCDGFVTMQPMHKVIGHLRKKNGPELKIQMLYEDQPSNDFNGLFKNICAGMHIVTFADLVTKARRVAFGAVFRNSLMSSRPAEEKSTIIEQLFEKFQRKVTSCNPETFQRDVLATKLVAQEFN